ncbi:MAG: hypothetical protein RR248_01670 [Clostridia bacterium]
MNTDYKDKQYYDDYYAKLDCADKSQQLYRQGVIAYKNKQDDLAYDLFDKSSQLGHRGAWFYLGIMTLAGNACKKDLACGISYIRHSAKQFFPNACLEIVNLFDNGYVEITNQEAEQYCKIASQTTSDEEIGGQVVLLAEKRLLDGFTYTPYQIAKQELERGNIDALFTLYQLYSNDQKEDIACEYFKKAIAKQQKDAILLLAKLPTNTNGQTQVTQKRLRKAVNDGSGEAAYILGEITYEKIKQEADFSNDIFGKASNMRFKWRIKASCLNYTPSIVLVADEYMQRANLREEDRVSNQQKAFYWYQKGYDNGNAHCLDCLIDCYKNGVGVEKDLKKAHELESLKEN